MNEYQELHDAAAACLGAVNTLRLTMQRVAGTGTPAVSIVVAQAVSSLNDRIRSTHNMLYGQDRLYELYSGIYDEPPAEAGNCQSVLENVVEIAADTLHGLLDVAGIERKYTYNWPQNARIIQRRWGDVEQFLATSSPSLEQCNRLRDLLAKELREAQTRPAPVPVADEAEDAASDCPEDDADPFAEFDRDLAGHEEEPESGETAEADGDGFAVVNQLKGEYWRRSIEAREFLKTPTKARNLVWIALRQELDWKPAGIRDWWNGLTAEHRYELSPHSPEPIDKGNNGRKLINNVAKPEKQ